MQAAWGGAGRPGRAGRGPERQRERPPGAGVASPCAAPGRPAGAAAMHPGPPRAALRLWLGCVCLALVQAGKGAPGGGTGGRPPVPYGLPGDPVSGPLTDAPLPHLQPLSCLLDPRPHPQLSNPLPPPLALGSRVLGSPAPSSVALTLGLSFRSPGSFLWPREQLRTQSPHLRPLSLSPKPCRPTLQVGVAWVLWGRGLAPEGTAWGGVWWTPSLEAGCPLGPGLPGTLPLLMPCASPFWLLPPC